MNKTMQYVAVVTGFPLLACFQASSVLQHESALHSLFLLSKRILSYAQTTFAHSSADGHLDGFHFGVTMNNSFFNHVLNFLN